MEQSQQSIHDVIHPTAAFAGISPEQTDAGKEACSSAGGCSCHGSSETPDPETAWAESSLNPKNRIDSIEPLLRPLWRIDGCTAFMTQLYAVPLFMGAMPPYRIDVFVPEPATLPAGLRKLLDLDVTFYTRDSERIAQLGITSHVLRILQHWTLAKGHDAVVMYASLPFGSRIVFQNLPVKVAEARISVVPTHYLERQLLSVSTLRRFWGDAVELPPTVDIEDVEYVSQLHDSVCLVNIDRATCIFKAITSYTKYLYHELRQLLVIPPHPNVIARPVHLVTKRCSFGNKVAVVGFTVENHEHGCLRDLIPFLQLHGRISLADKVKWSCQLTSALRHLRETSGIFYPDLRLDNIVLSASWDAVMIDFEQRGVWCEFAAPEVNAIEHVRLLAIDRDLDPGTRAKYAGLLSGMLPGWEKMSEGEEYSWPCEGYNVPWSCLSPIEQEACEVYMLGRVLWCIFEASSAPQKAAVWLSYRWEPLVEFPGYTMTPVPMRDLIDRCTRDRQPGLSKHIVRQQDKLVMRDLENTGRSTARQVQQAARDSWALEIADSESWLRQRSRGVKMGDWNENFYDRPTLREVSQALEAFGAESCVAAQGHGARRPP